MSTFFVDYRVHHSSPEGILVQLPPPHGGFGKLTRETLGNDVLAERLLKSFATRSHVPALLTNDRDDEGYRMLTINLTHGWSDLHTYPVCIQKLVPQLLRKHLLTGLGTTTGAKLVKQSPKGLVFNIPPNTIAIAAYETIEDSVPYVDHVLANSRSSIKNDQVENGMESDAEELSQHMAINENDKNNNNDDDDYDDDSNTNTTNVLTDAVNAEIVPLTSRALQDHVHKHRNTTPTASSETGTEYNKIVEVRVLNYDVETGILNVTTQHSVVEHTPLDTLLAIQLLHECPAGRRVRGKVLLSSTDDGVAVIEIPITLPTGEVFSILGYYIYNWNMNFTSTHGSNSNKRQGVMSVVEEQPPILNSVIECAIEFTPPHPALQQWMPFVIVSGRSSFMPTPIVRSCQWKANAEMQWNKMNKLHAEYKELEEPLENVTSKNEKSAWTNELPWQRFMCATQNGLVGHLPWREHYRGSRQEKVKTTQETEYDDDNHVHSSRERYDDNDYSDAEDDEYGSSRKNGGNELDGKIRRRKLEEAIDAYERNMNELTPSSPDEFQRLLLANPNNSYVWTQYMAFHVNLQQYEQARQVAERALSTMGMREQEERRNIWVAYLNMENLYGTAESLAAVFRRALQQEVEDLRLYECLADIYSASRKVNQLLALCRTMTNKFRHERRAWERLGIVLVDQDKRDQLKRMLKDMSAALKRDDAALVIVHVAIHEYKHGSVENGRALFEGLLNKLPKRSDVWSAYIDQEHALLKRRSAESSIAHVRQLLERAVVMNFNAKVMQQFLTRFLNFEKEYGSAAEVEKVKERARAYVQAKVQVVTEAGVV